MKLRFFLAGIILAVFSLFGCGYDYSIEDYRARFVMPGGGEVRVQLDITYRVGPTPKSDGFKYVGDLEVRDLKCTDESGPISCEVTRERENRISWRFREVKNTSKKVSIKFKTSEVIRLIKNEKTKTITLPIESELSFPWAGVFRIPVSRARYEIVYPEFVHPHITYCSAPKYRLDTSGPRWTVIIEESPLETKELTVRDILQESRALLPARTDDPGFQVPGSVFTVLGILFIVAIFVFPVIGSIYMASKFSGKKGSGSAGCGGASGCSGGGCGGCGGCGGGYGG